MESQGDLMWECKQKASANNVQLSKCSFPDPNSSSQARKEIGAATNLHPVMIYSVDRIENASSTIPYMPHAQSQETCKNTQREVPS
jgi:hypothetical protein